MNIWTKAPIVARVLLGLPFVVFGLNGFLQFIPMPPPEGAAAAYMGGLAASGYFFPLLKATEIAAGLALLSGRFVPLALAVLTPILINIVAYHAFVVGAGLVMPIGLAALGVYLAWSYRDAYRPMLNPNARPAEREEHDSPPVSVQAAAA
ncbi:MAG: DoxX family protein [Deltaproteobacteria bacterium]|nr:DoxX family protein [Deltaproteobacteria bacterium]MBW2534594.1 DoxX family protein [Deltaproteobacteria bacterium]